MYSPEQIDALVAERNRLRVELDNAQTMLAEAEAVIGEPLAAAIRAAVARVDARKPYALTEAYDALTRAFEVMARSRNEWRARAKRVDR